MRQMCLRLRCGVALVLLLQQLHKLNKYSPYFMLYFWTANRKQNIFKKYLKQKKKKTHLYIEIATANNNQLFSIYIIIIIIIIKWALLMYIFSLYFAINANKNS